ncbi:MAG: riboflavin biosynthesis protein RibF [Planctomycetes bacterium]|nr:riboflavin biosynthesis protein RibF [Planctomycetota bacterium]
MTALEAAPAGGSVVSIGVFDGVHLGHQAILAANVARSRSLGAVPTVVTFAGHPKEVLLGRAPRTLTTLEHRLALFRRAGIEHAVGIEFDAELRETTAEDFAERVLVRGLATRALVLGFDSKFGRERRGTPEFLTARGFDVTVVPQVQVGPYGVSSTAIREAIELGDLARAQAMLGRPASVLGTVVHGDALGRRLGFPTANLDLHHELHPPPGVYYGRARLGASVLEGHDGPERAAVANIGFRPTVAGGARELRIEVHLLDFAGDLYDQALEFTFLGRLRGEQRFDGVDALVAQIRRDIAEARARLGAASAAFPR